MLSLMRIANIMGSVAVTAFLASSLSFAAAPAHAETQTHKDPRGDVTSISGPQPRAAKPGIDIVSLRNYYKGEKLAISLTAANLLKQGYQAEWKIVTASSTYIALYSNTTGDPFFGFYDVTGPPTRRGIERGTGDVCPDAQSGVRRDTITVAIPRYCLGDRNKVRVGGQLIASGGSVTKVDDSRRKDAKLERFKLGPVLKRN